MHIGLYFGSFNPIHIGHLIIANHVLEHTTVNKIWFVVSPHNPLKEQKSLLNEYDRFHLVELAIAGNTKMKASNIEFSLPRPSYTIDTLTYLKEKFPYEQFSVIMGSDSFTNLKKWKNYEQLISQYELIVYERPGFIINNDIKAHVQQVNAPLLEISSTYIRNEIREKRSIRYLVTEAVADYIEENRYYQ